MSGSVRRVFAASFAAAFSLCVASVPDVAFADDTSEGVMLPGLRSDPSGSVTVSAVSLAVRNGRIEAMLRVEAPAPGGRLFVRTPRFGWLGQSEPYPDRHFPELQIRNGGAPATTKSSFMAFTGSNEVTDEILQAGIDPFAIADTPPFVTPDARGADAFDRLKRIGAIEQSGTDYIAKWTVQRKVEISVSPGSNELTLIYNARPGYALRRLDEIGKPAYMARYCLSRRDLVNGLGTAPPARTFEAREYDISVSVDDRPPPSLSITFDVPDGQTARKPLIAFCGRDGKSFTSRRGSRNTPARTDPSGIVHLLLITDRSGHR